VISRIPFFRSVRFAGGTGEERSSLPLLPWTQSLKTWLRRRFASGHIDSIRAGRRFEELGETKPAMDGRDAARTADAARRSASRALLVSFTRALQRRSNASNHRKGEAPLYYAEEKTLAEMDGCSGA